MTRAGLCIGVEVGGAHHPLTGQLDYKATYGTVGTKQCQTTAVALGM